MTPEKKLCQSKRPDRDSNLQSQKEQLLLKPVVDRKVRFNDAETTRPLIVIISLRGKAYSTFITKDEGIVARCLYSVLKVLSPRL